MPPIKLSWEKVTAMRRLHALGVPVTKIATQYGVDASTAWSAVHWETWTSPNGQARRKPGPILSRYWPRVAICSHGDTCAECCWEWQGGRFPTGYGVFYHPERTPVTYGAHRFTLEMKLGRLLGPGMMALHTCHNPPCVSPAHLYEGTAADNLRDMTEAGRRVTTKGMPRPYARENIAKANKRNRLQGNPRSHLTMEDVEAIRAIHAAGLRRQGIRRKDLAAQYGLSLGGLDHILYEDKWCYKPSTETQE